MTKGPLSIYFRDLIKILNAYYLVYLKFSIYSCITFLIIDARDFDYYLSAFFILIQVNFGRAPTTTYLFFTLVYRFLMYYFFIMRLFLFIIIINLMPLKLQTLLEGHFLKLLFYLKTRNIIKYGFWKSYAADICLNLFACESISLPNIQHLKPLF